MAVDVGIIGKEKDELVEIKNVSDKIGGRSHVAITTVAKNRT